MGKITMGKKANGEESQWAVAEMLHPVRRLLPTVDRYNNVTKAMFTLRKFIASDRQLASGCYPCISARVTC